MLIDENTSKPIILAKDAIIGKDYLVAGMYYKIKILKKYGDPEIGYISSVLVESETENFRKVSISGDTQLIKYDKNLHKPIEKDIENIIL